MKCFRCGKQIKGTGAKFVPDYRLMIMYSHLHEDCKKNNVNLDGIVDLMKVRELAGKSNDHIAKALLKLVGFDEKKFKKDIMDLAKK